MELEVLMKVTVTDEDIDDIVTTAFEGGINYWCSKVKVVGKLLGEYASEQISQDGKVWLYLKEPDDLEIDKYLLDKASVLRGIKMYLSNPRRPYDITYTDLSKGTIALDTCQVDADVADMIIQYALFNEIVYG